MSDIKQYGARGPLSDPPILGEYIMVTYADHLAALRACEVRVLNEYRQRHDGISEQYFQQIRNDALDAAREAVANTPIRMGAFNTKAADLAAIDALKEKQ